MLMDNKAKFLLVHCSSAHKYATHRWCERDRTPPTNTVALQAIAQGGDRRSGGG